MTAVLRTVIACFALLVLSMGSAAGQIAARATFVADGSFDLPPMGPTAPGNPVAIAVAAGGELHIVDQGGQVMVYERDGSHVRTYGAGSLSEPVAVAIDGRGRAYVLDKRSKQVVVFDEGGQRLLAIAGGSRGASELNNPVALAIGPSGYVYVLDEGDSSVGVFSPDGAFIRQMRLGAVGQDPIGIAVGRDGRIFVAGKRRGAPVFALPPFPDVPWQSWSGHQTLSMGAIQEAAAISVDGSGYIVVVDGRQGQIWGGNSLDAMAAAQNRPLYGGAGTGRGSFRSPVGIAFTPERHVVVLDGALRKVERIELTEGGDAPPLEWDYPIRVSQLPPDPTGAVSAVGPTGDGAARFVLTQPGSRGRQIRVERVTSVRYEDLFGDIFESYLVPDTSGANSWIQRFGRTPGGVALNDSLVVITIPDEDRFHLFDAREGSSIGVFGQGYADNRRLNKPVGVALFNDGTLVVADRDNHRIAIFSADLTTLLASFPMREAWGVAVSPDGKLYAWPEEGLSVTHFPLPQGTPQAVAPGLLGGAVQDIKFDAQGNMFVLEQETSRVTVLDSSLQRVLVRLGGRDSRLEATHLSLDDRGNIYVANLEEGRGLVYRWDARLPPLETQRVTLSAGEAAFSWEPLDSEFVWGYRVSGARSRQGPYTALATTTEVSYALALDEGFEYRWLRVDPVSITGSTSTSDRPIPLAHWLAREAAAQDSYAEVLDVVARAEALSEQGILGMAPEVAQEVQWHAFSTECELGRYEAAVAREDALEGWEGEDRGLELHRLLANAHTNLEQYRPALASVRRALEVMPEEELAGEAGVALLQLGIGAAIEAEAFEDVVSFGEELVGRVESDREFELFGRLAAGHLALDNPQRALQIAMEVLARDRAGEIRAFDNDRPNLAWVALQASMAIADTVLIETWTGEFSPYVEGERRRPYYEAMTRFWASQDRVLQALDNFRSLLETTPEPEFYTDSTTVALTFDFYRALQDGDTVSHAEGLSFLAEYAANLPAELEDLRLAYQDSVAVFTPREETRARLGEGFQHWLDANFAGLIGFFEGILQEEGLTPEQEIIARAMLAGVYQNVGRSEDAETVYRGILEIEPLFDIDAFVEEVESLYSVTVFDAQVIDVFRNIRRIG